MKTNRLGKLILAVALLAMLLGVTAALAQQEAGIEDAQLTLGRPNIPTAVDKGQTTQPSADRAAPQGFVPAKSAIVQSGPPSAAPWVNILFEGFEGAFPGVWSTFDNNGSLGGDVCWDDEPIYPFAGSWSGFPAGNCADGVPTGDFYTNDMDSWLVYGPFSLAGKKNADLKFKFWNESEENFDYFYWCSSSNGTNFSCKRHSGDTGGYRNGKLKLKNLTGDSSVWIAFVFQSDGSVTDYGPYLDNIVLRAK
jgi:hypothetical protein